MHRICFPVLQIALLCGCLAAQVEVRYEYSLETLTRVTGNGREVIECTEPEGTGLIHGLGRGPFGTVYIAAERGLFSLSDDARYTTPFPRGEGAPKGEPRSLVVDERGTIWLATDQEFGCVDPVYRTGRVHFAGGPFSDVQLLEDGGLQIQSDSGPLSYRPALGPVPVIQVLSADSSPIDGVARVLVQAVADGAPMYGFRVRTRHRFAWQEDPEFEILGLEPGRHEVEFAALDRDLRRSAPAMVTVTVPYPESLSKSFVLTVILGSGGGLLALLLIVGTRRGGGPRRRNKAFLSTFLFFAVGLQVLAGIFPHARGWPFVGFSMYSEGFREGDHIYKPVLLGIREDGTRVPIDPIRAGYASDGYWQALLPLVYDGDKKCREFLEAFNLRNPEEQLRGFVIHDEKHRLTRMGPVLVAPVVMKVYPAGVLDVR